MIRPKKNEHSDDKPFRTGAAGAILAAFFFVGCSPQIESHGNIPDQQVVDSIRVGINNRAQVSAILGTPSARATFDQEAWYYVGTKTLRRLSFLNDEVLEREVLVIRFNKQGIVQKIERLDKQDGRKVKIVDRKTPTRGKELTLMEQLLGNVGRFNNSSENDSRTGP